MLVPGQQFFLNDENEDRIPLVRRVQVGHLLVEPPDRFVMPTVLSFRHRVDGRILEVRTYRVEDVAEGESPFRLRIRLAAD